MLLSLLWWRAQLPERIRRVAEERLRKNLREPVTIRRVSFRAPSTVVLREVVIGTGDGVSSPLARAGEVTVSLSAPVSRFFGNFDPPRITQLRIDRLDLNGQAAGRTHWVDDFTRSWKRLGRMPVVFPFAVGDCRIMQRSRTKLTAILIRQLRFDPQRGSEAAMARAEQVQMNESAAASNVVMTVDKVTSRLKLSAAIQGLALHRLLKELLIDGVADGNLEVTIPSLLDAQPRAEVSGAATISRGKLRRTIGSLPNTISGKVRVQASERLGRSDSLSVTASFEGEALGSARTTAWLSWHRFPKRFNARVVSLGVLLAKLKLSQLDWLPFKPEAGVGNLSVTMEGNRAPAALPQHFRGRLEFRKVGLRSEQSHHPFQNLSGMIAFDLTPRGHLRVTNLHLTSAPRYFQSLEVSAHQPSPNKMIAVAEVRGAALASWNQLLGRLPAATVRDGAASGRVQFDLVKNENGGPHSAVTSQVRSGRMQLTKVAFIVPEIGCELRQGEGEVMLDSTAAHLRKAQAYLGRSFFYGEGTISFGTDENIDLNIESEDLRLRDLSSWLLRADRIPATSAHSHTRATLRVTGTLRKPMIEGRILCISLPIDKPLLGETLTTTITFDVLRSPLRNPQVSMREQTLRLNLGEGLREIWKRLMLKPTGD